MTRSSPVSYTHLHQCHHHRDDHGKKEGHQRQRDGHGKAGRQDANVPVLRQIARFYIWVIRGTPLLVQLFIIFYGDVYKRQVSSSVSMPCTVAP